MTNTLEIINSEHTSWAFTLRKTTIKKGLPTEDDYYDHLERMHDTTNCIIKENVFEHTGGLHMHGVLQIPDATNMKLFRTRGWKLHLEKIWDYDGWRNYFMKEQIIKNNETPEDTTSEEYITDLYALKRSLFKR